MKTARVMLIGAGNMANSVHYPSLAEMDDVDLVALCDLVEEKLHKTADRFGIEKRYTDYREMLEKEEADAVYILMPPHHLFDLVIAALGSKRHVFVEKPPAVTTFQVRSFAREAEANGVTGMVGFNRRYIPMINYAKKAAEEKGKITQVVVTFYKHASAVYYGGAADVIGCDAIHAVDTIRYLAGSESEVEEVHSIPARYGDVVDNAWNAVMRFSSGVTGVLLSNWNAGGRVHTFEIHAPGISAFLDADDKGKIIQDGDARVIDAKEIAGSDEKYRSYGFYDQSRHFIDCVKTGAAPSSSFRDAVKTMELVDAIRRGV